MYAHYAQPAGATNTVIVTVTPEINQINLIANILAACVNNTSNTAFGCTTLFNNAVPPSPSVTSQPSANYSSISTSNEDTVQALYFMLTNPDSGGVPGNMSGLYNLATPQAPFQPYYTSAPTDWTIAVSFSSTDACTLSSGNGTSSAAKFLTSINDPAVDAQDNIWGDAVGTVGDLFEVSPTGTPLACGPGALGSTPTTVVLDVNSNAWVGASIKANASYNLYKWNGTSGSLESTWPTSASYSPSAVTADGNGNVFYADSNGGLNEFSSAATMNAAVTAPVPVAAFGSSADILYMQADNSGNLWVANTFATSPGTIFEVYPSTNTSGPTYLNGFETGTISSAAIYNPYGLGIGASQIYSSNGAGSGSHGTSYMWDFITPGSTGTATVTNSAVELAGNYSARGIAVDGASNVWQANNNASTGNWVTGTTTGGLYSVIEISSTGAALSATSTTGTGAYGVNTGGFQKPASFLKYGARGVAIDLSGNVWVGQNSASAPNIMELVGAAVPTVTPLALAAHTGQLGQMP